MPRHIPIFHPLQPFVGRMQYAPTSGILQPFVGRMQYAPTSGILQPFVGRMQYAPTSGILQPMAPSSLSRLVCLPSSRSHRFSRYLRGMIALLCGFLWLSACTGTQTKTDKNPPVVASKFVAQDAAPAPKFQLRDLRGDTQSLDALRGKVVLLNFWATWCAPCLKEMTHFQKMHEQHKAQGLEIVAVSVDEAQTVAQVGPLINRYGYTFRVLLDTEGRVVTQYNPNRHNPFSALIDRKGNIRMTHQGYTPGDEIEMEKMVKRLLQEPAP